MSGFEKIKREDKYYDTKYGWCCIPCFFGFHHKADYPKCVCGCHEQSKAE